MIPSVSLQATETLKCFHSVLSDVLFQSQIMRKHSCIFQRSHECFHHPALSWGYRTGTPQQMFYTQVWREILSYQSGFFLPSVFLASASVLGHPSPCFTAPHFPPRRMYVFPSLNCRVLQPLQIFIKQLLYGKH